MRIRHLSHEESDHLARDIFFSGLLILAMLALAALLVVGTVWTP